MMQSQPSLSEDEAFGITEERKKEWCLLAVSLEGHPTYMCMGCHKLRVTVETRGKKLPAKCGCGRALRAPVVTSREGRMLMVKGGHQNLIDGD